MKKVSIQIRINDYLISEIGELKENLLIVETTNEKIVYNLKENILEKENKELKIVMDFINKTIKYNLLNENKEFINNFEIFSLTNEDKKVIIRYQIESTTFDLNIKYETI